VTKKPPRTKRLRTVRWKFPDGTAGGLDAVELAMQEIRNTVQGLEDSEQRWRALADATLEEQRATWKEIKAERQRYTEALRGLAELVVVGQVDLAFPGGRPKDKGIIEYRAEWLESFHEKKAARDRPSDEEIYRRIARKFRDSKGKPRNVKTIKRAILELKKKSPSKKKLAR
jgi:hypothetical protein